MVNGNQTIKKALEQQFGVVSTNITQPKPTELERQEGLELQRQRIRQARLELAQAEVKRQPKRRKVSKRLKKSILKLQSLVGSAKVSKKTQKGLISFLKSRPNLPKIKGRRIGRKTTRTITRTKLPSLQSLLTPKTTKKVNPLQPNIESVIFPTGTAPKFTNEVEEVPEKKKGGILDQPSIFFK